VNLRKDRLGRGGRFTPRVTHEPGVSPETPLDVRTRQALTDFLDFAEAGARLVARGRDAYDGDEMLRLAAESVLHRIGKAVARLGEEFTQTHPGVSWRQMKEMRNIVAHEYGAIDYEIVWTALELDLPVEAEAVRRILASYAPGARRDALPEEL
jgi:uncharacterized protein with HEPN domain